MTIETTQTAPRPEEKAWASQPWQEWFQPEDTEEDDYDQVSMHLNEAARTDRLKLEELYPTGPDDVLNSDEVDAFKTIGDMTQAAGVTIGTRQSKNLVDKTNAGVIEKYIDKLYTSRKRPPKTDGTEDDMLEGPSEVMKLTDAEKKSLPDIIREAAQQANLDLSKASLQETLNSAWDQTPTDIMAETIEKFVEQNPELVAPWSKPQDLP